MLCLALYTFKQDLLLKFGRHLHLNETPWAAWHPVNLHGVTTGSQVFILWHISEDAPRLRIKSLVHSWPGECSIPCSSCDIRIHKSLPPVLSPSQRCFCAPLGGSTSPLTSANYGGEKEVLLQPTVLNLIFNSCKPGVPAPTFSLQGFAVRISLDWLRFWAAPATMNPLIREAKQEHQNWAPASPANQQNQPRNYS